MHIPSPADPFRHADWRHRRCEGLLDLGQQPSPRRDDAAATRWFLATLPSCCSSDDRDWQRVVQRYPAFDDAHQLRCGSDTLRRWGVEGYLLAGVAPFEVDERFCLRHGTAQAYAEQFLDVLGRLRARDYIINVVIRLHSRPLTLKDADTHIRLFGLVGGRHVIDSLLDYYAHPLTLPITFDGVSEVERQQLRQRLHVHVALLTHCLREGTVKIHTWELLLRLTERLSRDQDPLSPGVRLDVANYLTGMDPILLGGLKQEAPVPSNVRDVA